MRVDGIKKTNSVSASSIHPGNVHISLLSSRQFDSARCLSPQNPGSRIQDSRSVVSLRARLEQNLAFVLDFAEIVDPAGRGALHAEHRKTMSG